MCLLFGLDVVYGETLGVVCCCCACGERWGYQRCDVEGIACVRCLLGVFGCVFDYHSFFSV